MVVQIVCVLWGGKYSTSFVDFLYRSVVENTHEAIRFVCLTDRPESEFRDEIVVKPIPDFGVSRELLTQGCRAKLGVFCPDVLDPDLPTILIDLDTMVVGDVGRIAREVVRFPESIFMLRGHVVPVWQYVPTPIRSVLGRYYFGSSPIVGFYPGRCRFIAEAFRREMASCQERWQEWRRRAISSDERFISWCAQGRIRVWSAQLVCVFSREYMAWPCPSIERLRRKCWWVRRRRGRQVVITFTGATLKPERICGYVNDQIVRAKHRIALWNYPHIAAYWCEAHLSRFTRAADDPVKANSIDAQCGKVSSQLVKNNQAR